MRALVAGSSGFLGTALCARLAADGHDVVRLVRREAAGSGESHWDPYRGEIDRALVESADVVINLAGSPTMGNPYSRKWRRELRESRVTTTGLLAAVIAAAESKPAFLAGNAVGYYGDHGAEPVTEAAGSRGDSLMTSVCRDWHQAAEPAAEAGARVCWLRTSPVFDRRSAPLKQLRMLFRAGMGARLGAGDQRFPLVTLRDWLGAVVHLAEHPAASGPFNINTCRTPTNAEFTRALARAVHRPAVAFVPAPLLKLGAGPLAPELLGSMNVVPEALERAGYLLRDPDVDAVLRTALT